MTLITYPTRVHFADGVLQEALLAEIERVGCRTPLVIFDAALASGDFAARIFDAIPPDLSPDTLNFTRRSDLRLLARAAASEADPPDSIIAFGTARAIELSRKCRYAIRQVSGRRPLLFTVPGVDGLPGPCTRNLESWRSGLPSVLICDPTVTLNAAPEQSVRSVVLSLVRCVESYLQNAFNPPADGMALDGVGRCASNLPRIAKCHGVALHREVMAASLNAALSQEKGVGPALTLTAALMAERRDLNEADLSRLILPQVVREVAVQAEKAEMLRNVMGGSDPDLGAAVARVLDLAPMRASLSDLGISAPDLDRAAHLADGRSGLNYAAARGLLDAIF